MDALTISSFLVIVAVSIFALYFFREVACWYFKTTEIATYLKDIRDLLKNQAK
jgi:hypothetical protein